MSHARSVAAVLVGALLIAVGAQVSVPMVPVPTTLQTLALLVVAFLVGPRLAMAVAGLYLALVLLDLPFLSSAQQQGGWAFTRFLAAGYVVGFIPAAGVAGWLGRRGGLGRLLVAGLVAHAIVFAFGVPVLAYWLDWSTALANGLLPFLPGAFAKSLVAAGLVELWRRRAPGKSEQG